MPWVKLDDHFDEHPKLQRAGPFGIAMFVCALAYCNRNENDGHLPRSAAKHLFDNEWVDSAGNLLTADVGYGMGGRNLDLIEIADHLVHVGLFEREEHDYRIHDYEHYQPLKADLIQLRAARSEAGRVGGKASSRAKDKQIVKQTASKRQAKVNPVPVPGTEEQEQETRELVVVQAIAGSVDRRMVTLEESRLADLVLDDWNRQASQTLRSREWLAKIVMRIREHPELDFAAHSATIRWNLANPWWKGSASPAVIYGKGDVFEMALARANGSSTGSSPSRYGRGMTTKAILALGGGEAS